MQTQDGSRCNLKSDMKEKSSCFREGNAAGNWAFSLSRNLYGVSKVTAPENVWNGDLISLIAEI